MFTLFVLVTAVSSTGASAVYVVIRDSMSMPVSRCSHLFSWPSTRMRYDRLSVTTPSDVNGPSAPASAPDSEIVSRPHAGRDRQLELLG